MASIEPLSDDVCRETADAYNDHGGNQQHAADALGVKYTSFKARVKACRKRGFLPPPLVLRKQSVLHDGDGRVMQQWDKLGTPPMNPSNRLQLVGPRTVAKLSTNYDGDGQVTQQWVTERPEDVVRQEAWSEYAKALAEDLPRAVPCARPTGSLSDLLACYPVGDHHLGMLAWKHETGASYDLDIGEKLLCQATDYLMEAAPPCKRALIVFLGDFMHYDSFEPVTPTSRNQLDADGRYPKMVRAAVRSMRYMVEAALVRHGEVHVIVEIGNHDLSSSIFLMECLRSIYENEPRITVDTSPKHYHYFRFGSVLIGTHHGHGTKMENLPLIMATDVPKDWGASTHRYIWTGHLHTSRKLITQSQVDATGCDVEQFRVLPPADSWASQKGYRAIRDMKAIVMHAEYGEIARHTVNPEMLGLGGRS